MCVILTVCKYLLESAQQHPMMHFCMTDKLVFLSLGNMKKRLNIVTEQQYIY